jgi:type II secretory pathway pseudopilin PulG
LVLGILSLPTLGLLGVGAMLGTVLGVVGLVKARNAPLEFGGTGRAVAGIVLCVVSILVMPVIIGIVAAIAIPSLLRARIAANEAAAIGDIRSVMSAEAAYAAVSGGAYGTPACLAKPKDCVAGYAGASFLDDALARDGLKQGYERRFTGQPASGGRLRAFAYAAAPATVAQTGNRSFCGDSSGRVCFLRDGAMPQAVDGQCPAQCDSLR